MQSYLLAAGGNVQIAGGIGKGARVVAGEMLVTGTIGEGIAFGGDKLTVAPGATMKGEVVAEVESPEKIHVTEGTVHGTVTIHKPVPGEQGVFTPMIGKILWALCLLFTALVLTLLFPRQIQRAGAILFSSVAITTLRGVLGVIAIPIATIILMITLVGLPVGLFNLTESTTLAQERLEWLMMRSWTDSALADGTGKADPIGGAPSGYQITYDVAAVPGVTAKLITVTVTTQEGLASRVTRLRSVRPALL